jgi:hypothetical protein
MQKMHKFKKRRGLKSLADLAQPVKNWQKMQKFTSEATAVHAAFSAGARSHPAVKTTVTGL